MVNAIQYAQALINLEARRRQGLHPVNRAPLPVAPVTPPLEMPQRTIVPLPTVRPLPIQEPPPPVTPLTPLSDFQRNVAQIFATPPATPPPLAVPRTITPNPVIAANQANIAAAVARQAQTRPLPVTPASIAAARSVTGFQPDPGAIPPDPSLGDRIGRAIEQMPMLTGYRPPPVGQQPAMRLDAPIMTSNSYAVQQAIGDQLGPAAREVAGNLRDYFVRSPVEVIHDTLGGFDRPRQWNAPEVVDAALRQARGEATPEDAPRLVMAEAAGVGRWIAEDPARAEFVRQNGYDVTIPGPPGSAPIVTHHWPGDLESPGSGNRAVWEASRENMDASSRAMADLIVDPTTWPLALTPAGGVVRQTGRAIRTVEGAGPVRRGVGRVIETAGAGLEAPSRALDYAGNLPQEAVFGLGRTAFGRLAETSRVARARDEVWERLQTMIKARAALDAAPISDEGLLLPAATANAPSPSGPTILMGDQYTGAGVPVTPTEQAGLDVVRAAQGGTQQPLALPRRTVNAPSPAGPTIELPATTPEPQSIPQPPDIPQGPLSPPEIPGGQALSWRGSKGDRTWYPSSEPDVRVHQVMRYEQVGKRRVPRFSYLVEQWNPATGDFDVVKEVKVGGEGGLTADKARVEAQNAARNIVDPSRSTAPMQMPLERSVDEQVPPVRDTTPDPIPESPPSQPVPPPPKPSRKVRSRRQMDDALVAAADELPPDQRSAFWDEYRAKKDAWNAAIQSRYNPKVVPDKAVREENLAMSVVRHVVETQLPALRRAAPDADLSTARYNHIYKDVDNKKVPFTKNDEQVRDLTNIKSLIEHTVFSNRSYKQTIPELIKLGREDLVSELVEARYHYRRLRGLKDDDALDVFAKAVAETQPPGRGQPLGIINDPRASAQQAYERTRQAIEETRQQINRNEQQRIIDEGGAPEVQPGPRPVSDMFRNAPSTDLDEEVLGGALGDTGKSIAQDFIDREQELIRLKRLSQLTKTTKAEAAELKALQREWNPILAERSLDAPDLSRAEITDIAARRTTRLYEEAISPPKKKPPTTLPGKAVRGIGKAAEVTTGVGRSATLYGVPTGLRYVLRQGTDNINALLQSGNADVLFQGIKNWKDIGRIYKDLRDQNEVVERGIDVLQRDRGRVRKPKLSSAAIEQFERGGLLGEHNKNKFVRGLSRIIAIPEVRDMANAIDTFTREQMFQVRYREGLPAAKEQLIERAWQIAQENGVRGVSRDRIAEAINAIETPSGAISRADVQEALRKLPVAPGVRPGKVTDWTRRSASEWGTIDERLDDVAMAEVNRVLFSYDETITDETLRKFIMFHYWQSRSIPLYAQTFIKSPHIAANYFRMMEKAQREADNPNTPTAIKGFLKVMSTPAGWAIFANPDSFVPFYLSVREAVEMETGNGSDLERVLNAIPFMPAPWIEGIMGAFALREENPRDPTYTRNARDLATQAFNWLSARGFVPFRDASETPMLSPVGEEGIVATQEKVGNWFRGLVNAPSVSFKDPTRFAEMNLRQVLVEEVKKANPNLSPDRLQQRVNDIWRERQGPEWDAALQNYTGREAFRAGPAKISPATITTRLTGSDDRRALVRSIPRDANGQPTRELTPQEEEALALDVATSSATQQGTDLAIAQQEYNALYETPGGQMASLWSEIVGREDSPPIVSVTVPIMVDAQGNLRPAEEGEVGITIPATILFNATYDERREFADLVVSLNGMTQEVQAFRDQQDALEAANPILKSWKDFQSHARDYPGGVSDFAAEMANQNPAYKAYYDQIRPLVESGERDESQFISREAYLAATGETGSIYDRPLTDLPVADPTRIPAIPGMSGPGVGASTGSGGGEPKSQADFIREDVARYEEAVRYANAFIRRQFGADVQYDQLDPFGQQMVQSALEENGFAVPYLSGDAANYMTWLQQQPPGTDTSVEAFLAQRQERRDRVLAGAP